MLLSLEFENSYSFRGTQDLNLARTPREARMSEARWPDCTWNHAYSPVAAIFGANAAGKSALFRTLLAATKSPIRGAFAEDLGVRQHAMASSEPTRFSLRFAGPSIEDVESTVDTQSTEYHLAFEVDARGVVLREELRFYPREGQRSRRIYKRTVNLEEADSTPAKESQQSLYRYQWGDVLRGDKQVAARITAPTDLFLLNAWLLEDDSLQRVVSWFDDGIRFYGAADYRRGLPGIKRRLLSEPILQDKVAQFIRQADLGITGLRVVPRSEEEVDSYRRALDLSANGPWDFSVAVSDFAIALSFTHSSEDGSFELAEQQESDGTLAMLSFAAIAIDALERGSVIVIDELDTSLHPLLVRELIRQFTSPETNPRQAQLIFTTHDLTLLHSASWLDPLLARDQIWLVEKSAAGTSELYSIAEFPVRNDENIFRKYLAGQYGSVPRAKFALVPLGAQAEAS